MFNFTKSFIGIGPLTIASAMIHAGVVLGLIGIIVCGLLCLYGVNIMVLTRRKLLKDKEIEEGGGFNYLPNAAQNAHRDIRPEEAEDEGSDENLPVRYSMDSLTPTDRIVHGRHKIKTYSALGQAVYGKLGYTAVTIVLFVQQLTIVTAYFYFLDKYFPAYVVLIAIAPICMFCDLKRIAYVSFSSLALITIVLGAVIVVSFANISDHPKDELKYADFIDFPLFFGICVFQFEGNTSCLQIENSMKSPRKFKHVSSVGIAIVILFKCVLAVVAYIAFVETTDDIVINSLPNEVLRDICGYMYCAAIVGSMPIQLNPVSDTIYRMTFLDSKIRMFRENPTTKYYIGAIVSI